MSEQAELDLPPLEAWQVEKLRMTCFPKPGMTFDRQNWWAEVVGSDPDSRTVQKPLAMQTDKGPFGKSTLHLGVSPLRIDWVLAHQQPDQAQGFPMPLVGPFPAASQAFCGLMNKWFGLSNCPTAVRLAYGAVLLQPVETRIAGYQLCEKYLSRSVTIDAQNSRDLDYRINRPRDTKSGIAGLRIYRLSRWATMVINIEGVLPSSGGPRFVRMPSCEAYAVRLELDINTASEYEGELPPEQLPRIFDELKTCGEEIAAKGDIP